MIEEIRELAVELPFDSRSLMGWMKLDLLRAVGVDECREQDAGTDVVGGFVLIVDEVAGVEEEAVRRGADDFDGADGLGVNLIAREEGDVAGLEVGMRRLDLLSALPSGIVEVCSRPLVGRAGGDAGVELFFPALLDRDARDGV